MLKVGDVQHVADRSADFASLLLNIPAGSFAAAHELNKICLKFEVAFKGICFSNLTPKVLFCKHKSGQGLAIPFGNEEEC